MDPFSILHKKQKFININKNILENECKLEQKFEEQNDIIYNIHKYVLKELDIIPLKSKISELRDQIKNCKTISQYNQIKMELQNIDDKINSISKMKDSYLKRAEPLLEEYKLIYNKPIKINDNEKNKYIYNFYKVANLYVKIQHIKPNVLKNKCASCGNDISNFECKKHSYICRVCGLEEICYINTIDFTEDNKQIIDKDKETFTKALLKFQGKSNEDIPENIIQRLYQYCNDYNIDINTVKKQDMYSMLQELGYPNYYEDINLILYKFNKTPLPDLSRYEEELKINYMLGENTYEKIKTDRKSSLNIQYLLFKHLELLGYKCSKYDFKIIETREILIGYDNLWKQICEKRNWPFFPTI